MMNIQIGDDEELLRFQDARTAVLWLLRKRCDPEFVQAIKSELGRRIQNDMRRELVEVGAASPRYDYPA